MLNHRDLYKHGQRVLAKHCYNILSNRNPQAVLTINLVKSLSQLPDIFITARRTILRNFERTEHIFAIYINFMA